MTNEHSGISRRKLLRTTAIAVPTASVLAFGSTLVTAPAANALKQDGWWGPETSAGLQRFMNRLFPEANLTVDGVITSQPDYYASNCPGITGGWEWCHQLSAITLETAGPCYIRLGMGAGKASNWFARPLMDAQVAGVQLPRHLPEH